MTMPTAARPPRLTLGHVALGLGVTSLLYWVVTLFIAMAAPPLWSFLLAVLLLLAAFALGVAALFLRGSRRLGAATLGCVLASLVTFGFQLFVGLDSGCDQQCAAEHSVFDIVRGRW
jgi:hypothetical protein